MKGGALWRLFYKGANLIHGRSSCGSLNNLPADAGDMSSIPGLGRSPGEGNGNPLHCSCLGNPMDRGAWCVTVHGVTKESDMTQQLNHNLIHKGSAFMIHSLPKGPTPKYHHTGDLVSFFFFLIFSFLFVWGLGFNMNFGGTQTYSLQHLRQHCLTIILQFPGKLVLHSPQLLFHSSHALLLPLLPKEVPLSCIFSPWAIGT